MAQKNKNKTKHQTYVSCNYMYECFYFWIKLCMRLSDLIYFTCTSIPDRSEIYIFKIISMGKTFKFTLLYNTYLTSLVEHTMSCTDVLLIFCMPKEWHKQKRDGYESMNWQFFFQCCRTLFSKWSREYRHPLKILYILM